MEPRLKMTSTLSTPQAAFLRAKRLQITASLCAWDVVCAWPCLKLNTTWNRKSRQNVQIISQYNVVTRLKCGWIFNDDFVTLLLLTDLLTCCLQRRYKLLRGRFWGFSPHRGDTLQRCRTPETDFYWDFTKIRNINAPQRRIPCAISRNLQSFYRDSGRINW